MPLWIGAYLADTMKLTTIQHGAYLLLLIAYWRERKPLEDSDDELRSITKLERAEWKRMRPLLAKFFRVADGVWWHKRVESEIKAADARSKKAADKAKKAAQARWGDGTKHVNGDASSMPEALLEDVLDECPTPSPTPIPPGYSEANASAADAAAGSVDKPKPKSPEDMTKAELWRAGKSLLREADVPEAQCGSFIGKLVIDYTDLIVIDAVRAAVVATPADPKEYIKATCMRLKGERAADHGKPLTVPSAAAAETQAAIAEQARHAAEAAAETPEQRAATSERLRRARENVTAKGIAA